MPSPSELRADQRWLALKASVTRLRTLQSADGSLDADQDRDLAEQLTGEVRAGVAGLAPLFPHDADYLAAVDADLAGWARGGFGVPDFHDSLAAFAPHRQRRDGLAHLVLFAMYTQNGNPGRNLEAVLLQVVWPDWIAELEASAYGNPAFVPVSFIDFTAGYDTNSAVLFPETVSVRTPLQPGWGAIFCDRESARFRSVVSAVVETTKVDLPEEARALLADPDLARETFVAWDLIHDRAHSRGDLPFDPFMIKQRMPFWMYGLEELRCDLTAFRASVELAAGGLQRARLIQYAVLFDRAFRFPLTGSRVRNYDGLGGQLLFAYLHQRHVLNWTDNALSVDWDRLAEAVLDLLAEIEDLYWRSIDRPKPVHWIAGYQLVTRYVAPNPASVWARGVDALPLDGPPKGLTDAVLPDEFPLSMFFEALHRRVGDVVEATRGIRA